MRERTLKAVGTSAALLAGSLLAADAPGILICTIPAAIGGFAGSVFPEWDNIGSEFSGGPSGRSSAFRLGNIVRGGNPVLADTRKKYLTEEERKLSSQTVGGLRYETRSIIALAVSVLPFLGLWFLFGNIAPLKGIPREVLFAVMIGFGTGYAVNILLTIISYGTFSRNGAKLLWPLLPLRFRIPLIHSEELLPDGGGVKDRRGTAEKLFAVVVTLGLIAAALILLYIRTDPVGYIKNM